MTFQELLDNTTSNPKGLFLFDGIGAVISTLFLGVLLVQLEAYIGMPISRLYLLASLAVVYAIYSFSCAFLLSKNKLTKWQPYLKVIAIANTLHCVYTVYLVVHFYEKLTVLGFIYFAVEVLLVLMIAGIEWKTATN